jgi:nicotinamide-nucleotide amidase
MADIKTQSSTILHRARATGHIIATAESCTGGMISAAITDIAGSSAIFDRGFVTYSNAAKMAMLGVRIDTLAQYGAVSEQTAQEMARGALAHSDATLAVATTGIAGPGGSDHKPEGRVCFALATNDTVISETIEFTALGRDRVRHAATLHALGLILEYLDKHDTPKT